MHEKAAAQAGLGELYAAHGNVNQAVRYLKAGEVAPVALFAPAING